MLTVCSFWTCSRYQDDWSICCAHLSFGISCKCGKFNKFTAMFKKSNKLKRYIRVTSKLLSLHGESRLYILWNLIHSHCTHCLYNHSELLYVVGA